MKVNFKDCLTLLTQPGREGGFSNHPKDKGGKTQWGIIQRVYNSYRLLKEQPPRDVRKITRAEMEDIYKTFYWDKVHGDQLPFGLDHTMFDFAVNSGPARSVKFFQKAINSVDGRRLKVDGVMGPATLEAAMGVTDLEGVITHINDSRASWVTTLWNYSTFKGGWNRRIREVKAESLKMAKEGIRVPPVRHEVPDELGKAGDVEPTNKTLWTTLSGYLGGAGTAIVSAISNPYAMAFCIVVVLIGAYFLYRYLKK